MYDVRWTMYDCPKVAGFCGEVERVYRVYKVYRVFFQDRNFGIDTLYTLYTCY